MRERLLTGHFLRRFLDNDLISPHTDRHEALTLIGAGLLSSGLFLSIFITLKYVLDPFQTPGRTAIYALDDRFFFLAISMTLMAIAAVVEWDALSLDARDAAILGPLPIPLARLVRAKLSALLLFLAGFALAINVVPAVLHPALSVAKLPLGLLHGLRFILAHLCAGLAAGAFGFFAVLGLRELTRALLGAARFARIAGIMQAALLLALVVLFLLLPGLSSRVGRDWLREEPTAARALPPLWFLGLQETIGGDALLRLPRGDLHPRLLAAELEATDRYRALRPRLTALAGAAIAMLASVAAIAVAAYAWNSRRLPAPTHARPARRRRLRVWLASAAQRGLVRHPVARAGFFFGLQCLARSAPHRAAIVIAAAGGLAAITVSLRGVELQRVVEIAHVPTALLAAQTVLITAVLIGVSRAARRPAEPRASWSLHLAWPADERPYRAGVKRAALIGVGLPALLALAPLHVLVLGAPLAIAHLLFGLLVSLVWLELALIGQRTPPLVSGAAPAGSAKLLAPLYALLFLAVTYAIASAERLALADARVMMALAGLFGVLFLALRLGDRRRQTAPPSEWDAPPDPATQRFDLSG